MIGASQGQSEGEAGRGERGGSETDERGSDEPAGTTPEFDVVADSQEPGRPQAEVFTVDDGDNEALPVFSGEGEAKMFLWLTMPVSGWRVRDISVEELVSMLLGPCLGVGGVVLDPPPEILAEEADSLVSLSRDRFVDLLRRTLSGAQAKLRAVVFGVPTGIGEAAHARASRRGPHG